MSRDLRKILIVGSSPAAYALAKKLKNFGIIFLASSVFVKNSDFEQVQIGEDNVTELLKYVLQNDIELTIPISEKALKSDIVSFFQANGQNIFGPTKKACAIATSKAQAKKFLYKIHAQTSKFGVFDKLQQAEDFLKIAQFPVTIKCNESNNLDDRLVCTTVSLAREFLDVLFSKGESNVLIEEYTFGHNFTIYYITDGYSALPIGIVGNYKFSENGDGGILTNGVGAYCPDYKVSETVISRVDNVVKNTLVALDKKDSHYVGVLGVDCTLTTEDKFYVNEFKPFLQDFDASSVLNLIDDDLLNIFDACNEGLFADEYELIKQSSMSSVSAVVVSRLENKLITGFDNIDDIENLDFMRVKKVDDEYLTQKGDAFVLTRTASTLNRAKKYLYADLEQINFEGIKYRDDILAELNPQF